MANPQKDRLIEMHAPRWSGVCTWFGFLAATTLVWVLMAGIIYTGASSWFLAPLVFLQAHLMHSHLIAFHEAAHGTLCPKPWLNEGLGIFIGNSSFMGLSLYRAVHHCHHAYLATERDEELWPFVNPAAPRWGRWLAAGTELALGLVYTPLLFLRAFLRKETMIRDRGLRRRIWMEFALMAAQWAGIVAVIALTGTWKYLFFLYLAPAVLAGAMQSLRKYVEHMGLTGSTVLGLTRSVVSPGPLGRMLAFTLFNEPYHGVHHKYARLPQAVLPEFASDLTPSTSDEPLPYPSYSRALRDMIGTLRDPRIGAQWKCDDSKPNDACMSVRAVSHGEPARYGDSSTFPPPAETSQGHVNGLSGPSGTPRGHPGRTRWP